MQRVNLKQYYDFGHMIHPLTDLPSKESDPVNYYSMLFYSLKWIDFFIDDKMIPMAISKAPAKRLHGAINDILFREDEKGAPIPPDWNVLPSDQNLWPVADAAKEFETVFSAELSNMATYFVSEKGAYNTKKLIESADEMFPQEIRDALQTNDKAVRDIREAGKCLVFDLGTAAGFHITRAVESVVLQYLGELCPEKLKEIQPSDRNLGKYLALAKEAGGDKKVCASIDQFRSIHRNRLIHPEEYISVDEAMIMLGIAQSAVSGVILDIKKRQKASGT